MKSLPTEQLLALQLHSKSFTLNSLRVSLNNAQTEIHFLLVDNPKSRKRKIVGFAIIPNRLELGQVELHTYVRKLIERSELEVHDLIELYLKGLICFGNYKFVVSPSCGRRVYKTTNFSLESVTQRVVVQFEYNLDFTLSIIAETLYKCYIYIY